MQEPIFMIVDENAFCKVSWRFLLREVLKRHIFDEPAVFLVKHLKENILSGLAFQHQKQNSNFRKQVVVCQKLQSRAGFHQTNEECMSCTPIIVKILIGLVTTSGLCNILNSKSAHFQHITIPLSEDLTLPLCSPCSFLASVHNP